MTRYRVQVALAVIVAVWSLAASFARAETRRLAVVVGSNTGGADHTVLRFAETDASKVARTLVELGGIAEPDLFLVQGRGLDEIRRVFEVARARVEQWHRAPDARVVFLFYFSGHSDGQSLELGPQWATFRELRGWVSGTGADVRLIIVDSCRSGSLLQSKGSRRAEPFEIHFTDDRVGSGEAIITSSAADESSLESAEIRGSFFTHHLVSGLRGAADASGDGTVSLAEAYDYAFVHTVSATANTVRGTQHPSYDYRLSGQGDLVLTDLNARSASLTVPDGYERVLVTQLANDQVIAELTTAGASPLALQPGAYGLRAWKGGRVYVSRVVVADRQRRALRSDELTEVVEMAGVAKGPPLVIDGPANRSGGSTGPLLVAAAGVTAGIGREVGAMGALRLGLRGARDRGLMLNLDAAGGAGPTFTEYRALLLFGYRAALARGAFSAFAAGEGGAGIIAQRTTGGRGATSPVIGVRPALGVSWRMTRRAALELEGDLMTGLYRRDAAFAVSAWPAGYLGIVTSL